MNLNDPPANRAREMELLETRQLFSGFASSGPGYFPGLQPFAHYIEVDLGIAQSVPGGPDQIIHFQPGDAGATAVMGNSTAASSGVLAALSRAAQQSSDIGAPAGTAQNTLAAAPRSTLGSASAQEAGNQDAAAATDLLKTGAAAATIAPVVSPLVVIAIAVPQKVFADRSVTVRIAAAAAPAAPALGGLANLLVSPSPRQTVDWQAIASLHSRRATDAAQADAPAKDVPAAAPQGPADATLATLPTGTLSFQPLVQRIAAAAATVVILTANWMVRRKPDKARLRRA